MEEIYEEHFKESGIDSVIPSSCDKPRSRRLRQQR
jgi:hypothetical protein